MEKFLKYLFAFSCIFIVQTACLPVFFSPKPAPQLILLASIALSLILGFQKSMPIIIAAGLFYDIIFGPQLGVNTIMFAVAAYSASFISRRFLVENKTGGTLTMVSIIILTLAANRLYFYLYSNYILFQNRQNFELGVVFGGIIMEVFVSIIMFFMLVMVFQKIEKAPLILPRK